ncbi:DUF4331 domain-containing protein [Roseateles toxinivorans]|uniref:Uncharacterized protein DUF4331 n=1 Tax=Roseateles toxinivorans TaxID=270368 RepID=A0A4R6QIK0_9BURK|nr:DUF4331 domain-containing protein [Roseateles toxinivorans]TDP61470.1 uncharacterized protein DUF4331 [Roseateles toxinivorans]
MKTLPLFPHRLLPLAAALFALTAAGLHGQAQASSHREAPSITTTPKVDASDFYMFNSYETGRGAYVTLIANYLPLQDAYGGPNYFTMDPNALYEIHIDNNGDATEDLSFQFRFKNTLKNGTKGISLAIGDKMVAIPLMQAGQLTGSNAVANSAVLNVNESFSVDVVRGDRRTGTRAAVKVAAGSPNGTAGSATFDKPVDNIGVKTIPDYAGYAAKHIYTVDIPGCAMPAKLFVGQRKDPFAVNLGTIFDLVNASPAVITNPANIGAAGKGDLDDKNITTLALEVPKDCLTAKPSTDASHDPVIGGWTTASLRQGSLLNGKPKQGHQTASIPGGAWTQVSRLGNPLVNEVVIGLPDKDRFNASKPKDDLQFADYVTNPTLPALLGIALAGDAAFLAPTNLPRTDLLNVFLTGIAGVNKPAGTVTPAEMLRLNTKIAAVPFAQQNRLGVAGEVLRVGGAGNLANAVDLAGFPNGRRPKDDVVDIALVAVAGGLCVINSNASIGAIQAGDNANVLGLNSFVIPGTTSTTLTSECRVGKVPLGATSAALHDAVDQATVPLFQTFPYLYTPTGGTK